MGLVIGYHGSDRVLVADVFGAAVPAHACAASQPFTRFVSLSRCARAGAHTA